MQKAIGYIRVSTQGQADEGVSLAAQRAKIEAWCSLNDAELVAVFEDAGISGASMNGREGLHAALKATTKGMALVTYSISRLARSTRDMLEIAERLDAKGADLVSMTEKIDTTTAAGRMVFKMLAVLADFERDQIGERTKMALAHKKAKGEVKQQWAKAAGDPQKHAEGAKDKLEGDFQQKTGQIKRDVLRD